MTEETTMVKLKVRPIGTSLGVILPKEILEQLNVGKDDVLYFTRSPDGFHVTPYDDGKFEQQMTVARAIMKRRRAVLRELAK